MLRICYMIAMLSGICIPAVSQSSSPDSIPLDKITLPENYYIEIYASGMKDITTLAFAGDGTLFAGSSDAGIIYAVSPDRKLLSIATDLKLTYGIDYFEGDLYVSEMTRIVKFEKVLEKLPALPRPRTVFDNLPIDESPGSKFIRIGPDKKIYISVEAPCDVCIPQDTNSASILQIGMDGSWVENYAHGIRNCLGFDWDPANGMLWFTDKGRSDLGDQLFPDELNKAPVLGLHFGFPFVYGKKTIDQSYWALQTHTITFTIPQRELPAHSGPQGMCFYSGDLFEAKYKGGIFIAEYGSGKKPGDTGCRIAYIPVREGHAFGYEVFASGWIINNVAWGRPSDVRVGTDGALYVSDNLAGCVYRIFYKK
jgi:glucose/arabinose dehydrogenase